MARKMKFFYRVGLTVIILSFILLYVIVERNGLQLMPRPQMRTKLKEHMLVSANKSVSIGNNYLRRQNDVIAQNIESQIPKVPTGAIVLAVVVCGNRANETLVMLKSAAALTRTFLYFIIMVDNSLRPQIQSGLAKWPEHVLRRVAYRLHPITFPADNSVEWRKLFKPCASQRLFLPTLLRDVDSLLYVDTDVLFLRPLDYLWQFFRRMNSSQMAAMTPEHEDFATGWYNRFARHPFYKPLGVNSGVMLMNLTRMRTFGWQSQVVPIYKEYKFKITWGDQDIINIIFSYHPEKLYVYPCEWNFRPDHCMYTSVCKSAEENGISVLHGNRAVFHNAKQPAFKAVYRAFEQYNLDEALNANLVNPMQERLMKTGHTSCGKLQSIFLKALKKNLPAW